MHQRWFGGRVRLSSPTGQGVAESDGSEAEGWRLEPRVWTLSPGLGSLRAGAAQALFDEWPETWWTRVHMRDGQVLGAIRPSDARLGLALATGLMGLVARGQLRLVAQDRVRWALRGERRRVTIDPGAGGFTVLRGDDTREAGLQGLVLRHARALDGAPWVDIIRAMRSAAPDGLPHAWLRLAGAPHSDAAVGAVRTSIEEEPERMARLVQDAIIGFGGLPSPE